MSADDLLPERALAGDPEAEHQLGGVLESCARWLFVHSNTVRYRLRRIADGTGRVAGNPRDTLVLRVGLAVGRLAHSRGLW